MMTTILGIGPKSLRSVMSAHGLEQAMLCPDVAMCIFPTVVQEFFMAEWGLDSSRPLAKKGDGENKLRTYRLFKILSILKII